MPRGRIRARLLVVGGGVNAIGIMNPSREALESQAADGARTAA